MRAQKGVLQVDRRHEDAHAAGDCRQELFATDASVHRCVEEDVTTGAGVTTAACARALAEGLAQVDVDRITRDT